MPRHVFTKADLAKSLVGRKKTRTKEDARRYQRAWYHRNKVRLGLVKADHQPRAKRVDPELAAELAEQVLDDTPPIDAAEVAALREKW